MYSQPADAFDFSAFLNFSQSLPTDASPDDIFAVAQLHAPNPATRPESSHSHHSSVSGSEYSYTTTEVDTDELMSDPDVRGVMDPAWAEIQGNGYPSPGPLEPATMGGGVFRGIGGMAEEDMKRRERLERES